MFNHLLNICPNQRLFIDELIINMSVKIFRVEGVVIKPSRTMPFSKDVRALNMEDAVEKVYADLGSQHRARRVHVKIASVDEVSIEEVKDTAIRELSEG